MSGGPSAVAGPQLIFLGQSIRGFWIVNWLQAQTSFDKVTTVYQELAPMVASGTISFPVAGEFSLEQYPEALALAGK